MNGRRDAAEPENRERSNEGFTASVVASLVLFGALLEAPGRLRSVIEKRPRGLLPVALLEAAGMCALVSLAIVGMLDGPGVVQHLLSGDIMVHSQTLLSGAVFTYLLVLAVIAGAGFLAPLLLTLALNHARARESRRDTRAVLLTSVYGMLPSMMVTPLLFTVTLIANWSVPFTFFLLGDAWTDWMLYAFAGIMVLSLISLGISQWKMLAFQWWRAVIGPVLLFLAIAWIVLQFTA